MISKKLLSIFLLITFVLLATTVVSAADSSDGETAVQSDMQANTVSTSDQSSDSSDSSSQATTSSNTQTTTNTHSNSETISSTSDTNTAKTTSDTSSSNTTNTEKTSDASTQIISNSDNTKNSDTQITSTQTTTKDTTSSQSSVSDVKTSSSDTKEANNTLTTVSSNLDEKTQLKADLTVDGTTYTAHSYDDLVSAVTDINTNGVTNEVYTINLGDGSTDETYEIDSTITWGTGTAKNLIIDGQNHVTIDGLKSYHFMTVNSGYNLTLQNITIVNCTSSVGGAVSNGGNLTINGTTLFKDNHSSGGQYSGGGGAIYNTGNLTIEGSTTFDNNTAASDGGAISSLNITTSNIKPSMSITGATFINNNATMGIDEEHTGRGGAIYSYNTNLIVTDSYFINNEGSRGGAICSINNNTTVQNSYFYGNIANFDDLLNYAYGGGALDIEESNLKINGTTFTKNSANKTYGGAVNVYNEYAWYSKNEVNITNSTFDENSAYIGGGLSIFDFGELSLLTRDSTTIENLTFKNNTAFDYGGGMTYVSASSYDIHLNELTFIGNEAKGAGGLAAGCNGSDVHVQNSVFINNTAIIEGGAFYEGGEITDLMKYNSGKVQYIENCNFTGNKVTGNETSGGYGGAIYGTTIFNITNSNFTNNYAPLEEDCGGGAIAFVNEIVGGSSTFGRVTSTYNDSISNSIFTNNTGYQGSSILIMGYNMTSSTYDRVDTIINCTFTNDVGVNGIIETYNSLNITNCTFENEDETSQDSAEVSTHGAAIVLNGLSSEENPTGKDFKYEPKLNINNSVFTNLTSDKGGAIFAGLEYDTIKDVEAFINITNCNFTNCTAYYGGAIFLDNIEAHISSSNFINNTAISDDPSSGNGGAIYITGEYDNIEIINNYFEDNLGLYDNTIYTTYSGTITGNTIVRNDMRVRMNTQVTIYSPIIDTTEDTSIEKNNI